MSFKSAARQVDARWQHRAAQAGADVAEVGRQLDAVEALVVRLNPEGNDAILSVADDGIGLPGTVETAGTGLGLNMVRGLAQQIRGILSIENDDGSCMALRFKPERPLL